MLGIVPIKVFIVETPILMKHRYYKRSTVISVSCNEANTSEAIRIEVFKPNFPIAKGYWKSSRYAEGIIPVILPDLTFILHNSQLIVGAD